MMFIDEMMRESNSSRAESPYIGQSVTDIYPVRGARCILPVRFKQSP